MEAKKRQLCGDEVSFWQDIYANEFKRLQLDNGDSSNNPARESAKLAADAADLAVAELRARTSSASPEVGWRVATGNLSIPAPSLEEARRELTTQRGYGCVAHLEGTSDCGASWRRLRDDGSAEESPRGDI